jgi:hypothetical protein
MRRIFGPKWDEMAGGWRKLHYEERHNSSSSTDIISMIKSKRMRWSVQVACMGEIRNAYKILIEKPEGKRPLGRSRRRRQENIKMNHKEYVGGYGLDPSSSGYGPLTGSCEHVS